MNILYIAKRDIPDKVSLPAFHAALSEIGTLRMIEQGESLSEAEVLDALRSTDVLVTGHGSLAIPASLAEDAGRLRYICHMTGTVRGYLPEEVLHSGIPVTNWGDSPAVPLADSALTLLLALLKELPRRIRHVEADGWAMDGAFRQGSLRERNVGLYGFGFSGREFLKLLRPFGCSVRVYDPFVDDLPEDARRVGSLEELFRESEVISIHAGLTEKTRGSVDQTLLSRLPDGGIVINTARGDIIDQPALFSELESGRLRAGLDVLADSDWLPPGHPARSWPNLLLTCHQLNLSPWPDPGALQPLHRVCLDNVRRFRDGEPPRFQLDPTRLSRMT